MKTVVPPSPPRLCVTNLQAFCSCDFPVAKRYPLSLYHACRRDWAVSA
jgi:hypothetical protein